MVFQYTIDILYFINFKENTNSESQDNRTVPN